MVVLCVYLATFCSGVAGCKVAGNDAIEMQLTSNLVDKIHRFDWCMLVALIACEVVLASQLHADASWLRIKLALVLM